MASFNLLRQPWINVIDNEYAEKEVSLIELFEHVHELRSVTDSNPLVIASVYRLLLVILYRALQLPDDEENWLSLYESGKFPENVAEYLHRFEDRLDLFSEQYPFFQTAGFTKDATTSVKKLSPDFATANNKTLFSHHSDDDNFAISPADTAKYLLVCQYFSLGGGISGSSNLAKKHPNYTHSPLIGGALTYLTGDNLFKTLMFNLKPLGAKDTSPEDLPVWENDDLKGTGVREPFGTIDYMTFKCRHVRFLPDECGNVSEMYITQGYSLPADSPYRETEPAFAYRLNKKQEIKTVSVNFEKSFWRDSRSIYQRIKLESDKKTDKRPACFRWMTDLLSYGDIAQQQVGCFVIGLENDKRKAANPIHWLSEILPVNVQLLMEDESSDYFAQSIEKSEEISNRIYYALQTYAEYTLPDKPKKEEISKVVERIDSRANYWSEVGQSYPHLVREITQNDKNTYQEWLQSCIKAARRNLDDTLDNQLGRTTKELKAKSLAQHKLNVLLAPYNKELSNEE